MAFRGLTLERVVYPRGHKRQFMNAESGGWNGQYAMLFFLYTMGLFPAFWLEQIILNPYTKSIAVAFLLALLFALPFALVVYFFSRRPFSLVNVVAGGVLIATFVVLILENDEDSTIARRVAGLCEWSSHLCRELCEEYPEHCPESAQGDR